ncbi:MAG: L-isoaspartyl protein carboxyl methyltransferase, partial [Candidatus Komeilibacteria bacterium]
MIDDRKEQLINYLKGRGLLKSPRLEQALRLVDRRDFIGANHIDQAYNDHPLSIGFGQTISQPSTVVFMLEQLDIEIGDKVLDVGSGSGWQTAL